MLQWSGKRVVVAGLGKSGTAAARYLHELGAKVTVCDEKPPEALREVREANASFSWEWRLGPFDPARFRDADAVVLSPGVPRGLPAVRAALEAGVPVINEPGLALARITAPVIAVTGTSGKTSTCTLIAEMLRAAGRRVFLGGNIGNPLLDLVMSGESVDWVVAELSSFQLETVQPFRPRVVVYTPIALDHLDRYPDAEAYHGAKARLLEFGDGKTTVCLRLDNPVHDRFAERAPGPVLRYGYRPPKKGAWYDEREEVLHVANRRFSARDKLAGLRNRENLAAAACALWATGENLDAVGRVVDEFRGIPHRMELVRERGGVRFFNDSKATNVLSAVSALEGFADGEVVLIAGGRNKANDFSPLREVVSRKCRLVVLLGEAREALAACLEGAAPLVRARDFPEAVRLAAERAEPGQAVVLSPACASQDMFRNYEERGARFRELVAGL